MNSTQEASSGRYSGIGGHGYADAQATPTATPYTQRTLNALMQAIELVDQLSGNLAGIEARHFNPPPEPVSITAAGSRPVSVEGQMAYDTDMLLDALNRALSTSRRLERI